ncbi:conserved hypothetical protein [Neisseria lactamica 020-06]|nr:conserved hypothetical protein [Neisseria lactamica 020-06]
MLSLSVSIKYYQLSVLSTLHRQISPVPNRLFKNAIKMKEYLMRKLQNTLYITTQGSYLHKERETLVVEQERKKVAQLPVHSIGHIFCFGNVLVSPFLLGFCGENNVNLAFFTENGRFLGRLQGRQSGNVLLRRAQYRMSEQNPVPIARNIIAAKIQAGKRVLQRQIRNHGGNADIQTAVAALNFSLQQLKRADSLDLIRGIEGDAAARYFGVFGQLVKAESGFAFDGRNRRPPRDSVNALLSFLYSILGKDISGALQGVGLDPQVGFLHADRPGRDSLAQDILEEFRAWWADRLVLSLINRGQIKPQDFIVEAGGAVSLKADARKLLFQSLQAKKQEKITHPFLGEEVEIGLLPYIQAMLLARHLRGDLAAYPPFLMR